MPPDRLDVTLAQPEGVIEFSRRAGPATLEQLDDEPTSSESAVVELSGRKGGAGLELRMVEVASGARAAVIELELRDTQSHPLAVLYHSLPKFDQRCRLTRVEARLVGQIRDEGWLVHVAAICFLEEGNISREGAVLVDISEQRAWLVWQGDAGMSVSWCSSSFSAQTVVFELELRADVLLVSERGEWASVPSTLVAEIPLGPLFRQPNQ